MNWMKRAVVITTCVMILCCSVLRPVSASAAPYAPDDPLILDIGYMKSQVPSMYSLSAGGLLYSFGGAAETIAAAAPWAAGILIAAGGILVGGYFFCDALEEMIVRAPEFYNDVCTLIAMGLESEFVQELEAIADAIVNGKPFTASEELLDALAESTENVINESVAIDFPSSVLMTDSRLTSATGTGSTYRIFFSTTNTFNANDIESMVVDTPIFVSSLNGDPVLLVPTYAATITDYWNVNMDTKQYVRHFTVGTNPKYTGFYKAQYGENEFYVYNIGYYGYQGWPNDSFDEFIAAIAAQWAGSSVYYLATPFDALETASDLITGESVAAGSTEYQAVTRNPAIPTDEELTVAVSTTTTVAGTVVKPIEKVESITLAPAIALTLTDALAGTLDLTTPEGIKGFFSGFGDYVSGLFDWLPVQFTSRVDGFFVTLVGFVILMVGVKIIDIIWP